MFFHHLEDRWGDYGSLDLPIDLSNCLTQLGYVPHYRGNDSTLSWLELALVLDSQTEAVNYKHTLDVGWSCTIKGIPG